MNSYTTWPPAHRLRCMALGCAVVVAFSSNSLHAIEVIRPEITEVTIPAALSLAAPDPWAITVNFSAIDPLTPSQQAIFTTAANHWDNFILGYKPGISLGGVVIAASAPDIDGPGMILGQAGPTFATSQGGFTLATQGVMRFDAADLAALENSGRLLDVIVHEMGHVLGIGTLWDFGLNDVYVDGSGEYTGAAGLAAYQDEFNQPTATYVPVELGGNAGTFDAHWNEVDSGFGNTGIVSRFSGEDMRYELMTGWLNAPTFTSSLTVMSLMDIGFETQYIVPEPSSALTVNLALAAVALVRRRG